MKPSFLNQLTVFFAITLGITGIIYLFMFGIQIIDSHNICNSMNMTGCNK